MTDDKVKLIRISTTVEEIASADGFRWVWPVRVDWFPPLTLDQHAANAIARADGEHEPFADPNLIYVELDVSALGPRYFTLAPIEDLNAAQAEFNRAPEELRRAVLREEFEQKHAATHDGGDDG